MYYKYLPVRIFPLILTVHFIKKTPYSKAYRSYSNYFIIHLDFF